jgi:F-type H+-transporting ATPase subunit delta
LLEVVRSARPAKDERVPKADELAQELRQTLELLEGAPELQRVLADPLLPTPRKRALAEEVFTRAKASPLLVRLLGLLVEAGRTDLLPGIEEAFRQAWNAERGVAEAEAVTAVELDEKQREALTQALAGVSGHDVDLRTRLDPRVIGGVLVRMAGKSYDGTVRGRLKAMRARLVHGT